MAEQLVRNVCALARKLKKKYVIVDTPIGPMSSILQDKFHAEHIQDKYESRKILSRSIHLQNSGCFVYRLDVDRVNLECQLN